MKLSSLIGKQALTTQGENLGYVLQAYFSRNALSSLLLVDGEEEEFYVPARAVLSWGDALVLKNLRISAPTGEPAPLSRAVFSDTGEALGTVRDFAFGDEEAKFITEKDAYPLPRVAVGDTLMVYPVLAPKPQRKRPSAKKSKPSKAPETKVDAPMTAPAPVSDSTPTAAPMSAPVHMSEPAPVANSAPATAPMPEPKPVETAQTDNPADAPFNRYNLLGRRVKKTVYDVSGYPLVRAGELITPSVLSTARRNNKLLELTVKTLTNII